MKEYVVLEIKCKKDIKFFDIYSIMQSNVVYNRNLFAFQNLNFNTLSTEARNIYHQINLSRFEYKVTLEHLLNASYYNPEQHDKRMVSNLDESWDWSNKYENNSLNDEDFKKLFVFSDLLKALDVYTLILGFDQIEWDGKPVCKGTYGFEKANSNYGLGRNYLSNSVIAGRTYENKPYTALISCERCFRNLDIINNIADSLGKIVYEEIYYAPENKEERYEWAQKSFEATLKFENAISQLHKLNLEPLPKNPMGLNKLNKQTKINIKKYIRTYLCTDGWDYRPARSNEHPTVIYKNKDNKEIVFSIISGHGGQHLQVIISYSSKEFYLSENLLDLFAYTSSEQEIEKFFANVVKVREYFYALL
ncbi:MAG: hypothetical protein IKA62_04080 [Clostridia bacterium]|nr:hypothetical protein [Clostridia bacterium]